MTLDEMAAELIESWQRNDPEMTAAWDRGRLWSLALSIAARAKADAHENASSDRSSLMTYMGLYPEPGIPGPEDRDCG
jgi:hypothetical protein